MLADTDNVDPSTNIILITRKKIYFLISMQPNISDKQNSTKSQSFNIKGKLGFGDKIDLFLTRK